MKKFGLLAASLLFVFIVSACGKSEALDKSQVLAKSIEASKTLKGYSVDMKIDIDAEEMKQTLKIDGDISHNPDTMHLNMNMGMPGMTIDTEIYVNEDETYMSLFGEWMKMGTDELGISSFDQMNEEEMEKLTPFIEQFEMKEEGDTYILTLSGNDDEYKVLIENLIASSLGDLSTDDYMKELLNSLKINQLDMEFIIDKKTFFLTGQNYDIDIELVEDGVSSQMKMKGESKTFNINEVEPIEVPADVKENAVTEDEMYNEESLTIEELQEFVDYQVLVPAYLPQDYIYTEGYYDETMEMATLSYDKDEDNWVLISINPVEYMSLEDLEGEEISVRNTTGLYYEIEGYLSIIWEEDGLLFDVTSVGTDVTKDQLQQIAESIQ